MMERIDQRLLTSDRELKRRCMPRVKRSGRRSRATPGGSASTGVVGVPVHLGEIVDGQVLSVETTSFPDIAGSHDISAEHSEFASQQIPRVGDASVDGAATVNTSDVVPVNAAECGNLGAGAQAENGQKAHRAVARVSRRSCTAVYDLLHEVAGVGDGDDHYDNVRGSFDAPAKFD